MRARYPDVEDYVVRDGVRLGFEVFGKGDMTVLLLPTWTIIHPRFWKMQVHYLARHFRVVTYDGPGNGRSDRVIDPVRYTSDAYAADAAAVLDACDVDRAVVVGLSLGAHYGLRLAGLHPERVAGLALIGPAIPLGEPDPGRAAIGERVTQPYSEPVTGWDTYNTNYWHDDHFVDFATFFFDQVFTERHSTKPRGDAVGWATQTTPDVLAAKARRPEADISGPKLCSDVTCPVLVVHGTDDRIEPHGKGIETARITDGWFVSMEGSGHLPNVRDPVRVNRLLRDFINEVTR